MPHERRRYLFANIKTGLSYSPIVGLLGHRQVGKTTLCEKFAGRYVTMDQYANIELANSNPDYFLEQRADNPLVIDECQLAPSLFPALKDAVRKNKKPGQFLLTGSVRFSSRRAIRESLTGRIVNYELLPLNVSEIHQQPLSNSLDKVLKSKTIDVDLKSSKHIHDKNIASFLHSGGLPAFFSIRNEKIREEKFQTLLETLLERDIRLLIQTRLSLSSLINFYRELAKRQGMSLQLQELSRQVRISVITIRSLLNVFESMFLLRRIQPEGGLTKDIVYLEDQGEASFLIRWQKGSDLTLQDLSRFLFSNLRHQWTYNPLQAQIFHYSTRGGAVVPLGLHTAHGTIGFIPMLTEDPDLSSIRSAASFQKKYRNAKILFVHTGKSDKILSHSERCIPISKLV